MIKLIACDMDGTLLQNGAQKITEEAAGLVAELIRQGICFVPASGRQYPNLQRLFPAISEKLIYVCENGALVMKEGQPVYKRVISRGIGKQILQAIRGREGSEILLSGMNTSYLEPKTEAFYHRMKYIVGNNVTVVPDIMEVEEEYLKISVYEAAGIKQSQEYWEELFGSEVTVVTSGNLWLDMIPKGVNKGTALTHLQQHLGIRPEETLAVGDHFNDVEMLINAGYAVAMENAQEGVKRVCPYRTDTVEHLLAEILSKGGTL